VLTPREYQRRWLDTYDRFVAERDETESVPDAISSVPAAGSCFGGSIEPIVEGWSLPGPVDLLVANPSVITQPHHDYAAWDWIIPANTPIYAVRGGTVVRVHQWQYNWWESDCGIDPTGCVPCGVGLTILDDDGTRWTYCHGVNLTINLGDAVVAGQQVMWSGNTGRSGTAHLHLEITTRDGRRRCPQPLLQALVGRRSIEPMTLATSRCWSG
jgi:murein DD-endopeptidase MepM/ murein hydrolase activator NlpD